MAAFTTWTALKQRLLDDFASGAYMQQSYTCGDTTITYRNFAEFRDMLQFVEQRAAVESSRPPARRTYAGQGGRGC